MAEFVVRIEGRLPPEEGDTEGGIENAIYEGTLTVLDLEDLQVTVTEE